MASQTNQTPESDNATAQPTLTNRSESKRVGSPFILRPKGRRTFTRGDGHHQLPPNNQQRTVSPSLPPCRGRGSINTPSQFPKQFPSKSALSQDDSQVNESYTEEKQNLRKHNMRHRSNSRPKFLPRTQSANSLTVPLLSKEDIVEKFKSLQQKDVFEVMHQHQLLKFEQKSPLLSLEEDNGMPAIKQGYIQQLEDQLETFENTVFTLSLDNSMTSETMSQLLNRLEREIKRLSNRLPIYAQRDVLIDAIMSNQVVILKGNTGSGKSTQLVQYLVDAGLADRGQIICTQPRRLAARLLASLVAEEFGCQLGKEVRCDIFGTCCPSPQTKIRFVTEAVLLNEYHADPMLSNYSVVIIDEAHERRLNTDIIFGVMKLCARQRKDLKLVIMSATMDSNLLRKYYSGANLIQVSDQIFPVEDEYVDENPEKYVDAAIDKVLEIHASQDPGDILVFLTGPDEIDRAITAVKSKIDRSGSVLVLPLYGKLNEQETKVVFTPTDPKKRKIIFATNCAETSITIDGIRYVVDSGMVKEVVWDSERNTQALKVSYTTQSSVQQRRGRAGRTAPGKCYHLYTCDTYESLDLYARAEILCIQPTVAVLKLKYLQVVDDFLKFDWLEAPSAKSLQDAVSTLTWIGALDSQTGKLTNLGQGMAILGLDSMLSAMILSGKDYNCLSYTIALAAMLTVAQNIWWRGKDERLKQLSNEKRALFVSTSGVGGDYLLLLRIFLEWNALGNNADLKRNWCHQYMINGKSLKIASDFIRETSSQLHHQFQINSKELNDDLTDRIIRCICAGFFQHLAIAKGADRGTYQLINNITPMTAQLQPWSTLTYTQQSTKFVLYFEILNLSNTTLLCVACPVDAKWLNQQWLKSIPQIALLCTLQSYDFKNLGLSLLLSIVGKGRWKLPALEKSMGITFEVNYKQAVLTIWGEPDKLIDAKRQLQLIIDRESEKLHTEVQEYEIVGSTRILLGAGAEPQLVLIRDEFTKVLLTNLPTSFTEEQIERKCQLHGLVRHVTMIQTSPGDNSASATYFTCDDARQAVTRLAHEIWNGQEINVSPSYARTSVYTTTQNCKLKAQWFMTESEGRSCVYFDQEQAAQKACTVFKNTIYCGRPTKVEYKKNIKESGKDEFIIELFELPPDIDEEVLLEELNRHHLANFMTNVIVFRKNLPSNRPLDKFSETADEDIMDLMKFKSLFTDRQKFNSVPDIQIHPATVDGRVVASILFSDPRDVMTAMNMYKKDTSDPLKFKQFKIHFVPNIDHIIVLNTDLAKAIPHRIEKAMQTIQADRQLSDIRLVDEITSEDNQEIKLITIKGTNLEQIQKARIIFDKLMKGLSFKFHSASWASAIFSAAGKKFLINLQDRTNTYIWWNWSSAQLTIFGEENDRNNVYREIDIYIQKALPKRVYSISIRIPEGCARQCLERSSEIYELGNEKAKVRINMIKQRITVRGNRTAVTECEQKVNNILGKVVLTSVESATKTIMATDIEHICLICADNFNEPYSLQQCGHKFCHSCLSDYFETHFDTTMNSETFKLRCPSSDCNKICLIRDIQSIVGFDKMALLATIAYKIHIREPKNDLAQCVGINCNQGYRPSENSSTYFCDQCMKVYCIGCQVEYHANMTCKEYQAVKQKEQDAVLLNYNLGNLPYKHCPKCHTLIEKYAGCNAMKCTQCNLAFCWVCALTDEDDVHFHYNDKNYPCYGKCFDLKDLES
ncbi:unnamed protein product [Rotaria socialis]|uniref:RNA helicase n=1 Tax=Rotaria socialis TaxID=392032 RepID=A0A820VQH0_9BILA|nr:unnamed protein product [Rotaria socialis]